MTAERRQQTSSQPSEMFSEVAAGCLSSRPQPYIEQQGQRVALRVDGVGEDKKHGGLDHAERRPDESEEAEEPCGEVAEEEDGQRTEEENHHDHTATGGRFVKEGGEGE